MKLINTQKPNSKSTTKAQTVKPKRAKVNIEPSDMSIDRETKMPNKMVHCLPGGKAVTLTEKQFQERNKAFFSTLTARKPTTLERQESKARGAIVDAFDTAAENIEWLIARYEERLIAAKKSGIKVVKAEPRNLIELPPSKIKAILEHDRTPTGKASNALYSLPYLQEAAKRLKALMGDLDEVLPIYTV